MADRTLLLGTATEACRRLADRLDADLLDVDTTDDALLQDWRDAQGTADRRTRVVVAMWPERVTSTAFASALAAEMATRAEDQVVGWIAALGAAVTLCRDGGAVVAMVDRPAPLDSAGHTVDCAVSDAVEALVRSLARSEGARGVRVNAVTTPARTTRRPVVDPAPPLGRFPGDAIDDTAGVVLMLLGESAVGVTGQVVHADNGRSWR